MPENPDYGDPDRHPEWGDPEDWGFDNEFGCWVYCGDDEALQQRWDAELTLWENDYEYGPHPLPPQYDPRFERRARITYWAVVALCVALGIVLFVP